jgi:hypothetical protein
MTDKPMSIEEQRRLENATFAERQAKWERLPKAKCGNRSLEYCPRCIGWEACTLAGKEPKA